MTERQKQHQGRSEGDETTLEGRDIKADAVAGTGHERETGEFEDGLESSNDALHIGQLLEQNRKREPGKFPKG